MASIRIIRRRIKSAQNIAQITRAMEMVSASKMKKAQDQALMGKTYTDKIYEATMELAKRSDRKSHPLLSLGNPHGKTLIILISTNKGLCGGLNSNLFRMLFSWFTDAATEYVTVGAKGQSFVTRTEKKLVADFSQSLPFATNIPSITELVVKGFLVGQYKEVYLAYNSFVNALKQVPVKKKILPIELPDIAEEKSEDAQFEEFVIEPSVDEIFESLLPHYLENQIRAAIFEGEASEHSARMIAMKNATDAANDLKGELTLILNKIRQEKITFEIADMVTARMAVEE